MSNATQGKPISHIAVLMAMHAEADPLIRALNLAVADKPFLQHLPMQYYSGNRGTVKISLITSGRDPVHQVDLIGPVPATLYANLACEHLCPDLVFSAGTAGGFAARGAQVGNVYLSEQKTIFHDRDVPLPGFDESGIGHFPVLNVRRMARELGLPTGVVSSGSSFAGSEKQLQLLHSHNAVAKEMEAAAIAWVCSLYEQPFVAVKSITNLLDRPEPSATQFLDNLQHAAQSLTDAMLKIIDYCDGRSTAQLAE